MCGIVGILDIKKNKNDLSANIISMLQSIRHRGPDNTNSGYYKNFHYGFNRLSIIDLSAKANQPFEDKKSIVMANCEIYNYKEYQSELKLKGHKFISSSDSETIHHGFNEKGIDFLKGLNGMFAISIYDKFNSTLYLARDRIGIKPLYYYSDENYFIFSSEIKAILNLSFINNSLNHNTLQKYLISGFGCSENTFINKIKSVKPGSFLKIKQNQITESFYYNKIKNFRDFKNENEIIEIFQTTIESSINSHLVSDVPTSLMLSNGKDSNIIKYEIEKNNSMKNFKTFTLGFRDFDKDESVFNKNRENHTNFIINDDFFEKNIDIFFQYIDQPTIDGLNTFFLTKLISQKGYKVVISGLGADELLGGYGTYNILPYMKNFLNFDFPKNFFANISGLFFNYSYSQKIKKLKLINNFENLYSIFRDNSLFDEIIDINQIFDKNIYFSNDNKLIINNTWRYIQELEINNYLQRRLLIDSDIFSMCNSVELRVPFISNDMIDLCLSVDFENFSKISYPKKIFNRIYSEKINNNILNHKKQGFALPMDRWLKINNIRTMIHESFATHFLLDIDNRFVNILNKIETLFYSNKISYEILWKYFVLDKWFKNYKISL